MTALIIAADGLSARRAAEAQGEPNWWTPDGHGTVPIGFHPTWSIVWVDGWHDSRAPAALIARAVEATAPGAHVQVHATDEYAQWLAADAGLQLDAQRDARAEARTRAALPPTLSPERMAAATANPARTPWWRRLFRKATR